MTVCKLYARIDSDQEVVIFPQNLDFEVTFGWMSDTLGISRADLIESLLLPKNNTLLLALYYEMFVRMGGRMPGKIIGEDRSVDPPVIEREPDIVMPEQGYTNADIAMITLLTLDQYNGNFRAWPVPKQDFWAPMTPTLLTHLGPLVATGPGRTRCVDVGPAVFPSAEVNELAARVAELEQQVDRLARDRGYAARHRLALEYGRRVLVLNEWQWEHDPRPPSKRSDGLLGTRRLLTSIADLDRALFEAAPSVAAERAAAADLLGYISPLSPAAPALQQAIETVARQPTAFSGEQIDDLLGYIRRAFVALSLSSLAEEFVAGHLIALFQGVVESLDPRLEQLLADEGGGEWQALWSTEWRDALTALRAGGAVEDDSPFKELADLGKYSKTALGIIEAGLNEATLPILLARLSAVAKSGSEFKQLARSLATCVMKGLLATGIVHRGAPRKVLFAGKDVTSWFKACARAFDRSDDAAFDTLAKELRGLELGKAAKGSRLLSEVGFLFSVASTLAAAEDTAQGSWQSGAKLLNEALGAGEALAKLTYAYRVQFAIEKDLTHVKQIGEYLGGLAAIVGFVVTVGDTLQRWERMSGRYKFAALAATASATVSVTSIIPFVAASARLARSLSLIGLVLGAVELGTELVIDWLTPETQKIFDQYRKFAVTKLPYFGKRPNAELAALDEAWADARSSDVFTKLWGLPGARGRVPTKGGPTWHMTNGLGFPAEQIAAMFDVRPQDVTAVGIKLGPNYDEADGAAAPTAGVEDG